MAGFHDTIESLFEGAGGYLAAKTVVGEPFKVGDATIVPLADVSFGIGAGAFAAGKNGKAGKDGGGMGGKVSPCAVLIIQNGTTRLVNIRNQDGLTKAMDMVPDLVNKFMPGDMPSGDEKEKSV